MQDIEEIYKQYFEIVNKYLFCLTHNDNLAEELTQETFYRAVKKIGSFKGECKIQVWLCQIAKNLWYDEIKKNKRYKSIEGEELELIALEDTEKMVMQNTSKLELFKKIQALDNQTKEVMYLRLTGDLTFKEIANILNKTENWARVTFYRGKQKILKEVEKNEREKRV